MELFETIEKGAEISDCGKYRYKLWRVWDKNLPKVLFIMLNPSTADGSADDPTIRRCIGFAKAWGYGGIMVGNISPFRATNPKELLGLKLDREYALVRNINSQRINKMAYECEITVLAYGNSPIPVPVYIFHVTNKVHCINETAKGFPSHPLYLKKNLTPKLYKYPSGIVPINPTDDVRRAKNYSS